jgi:3-carboxy-cis,cis-muconate cycloisomerase
MLEASARLTGLICGTQPMNDAWSPRATLQRMLDVEAALARASAQHKVIPQSAVAAIEAACQADQLDADALARDAALGGNLAIPLVKQLTARVKAADAEASKYVHWGATSQDIIDTATVLQLRDTFDLLGPHLESTCAALAVLARNHRATPMIGTDLVAAGAADYAGSEIRAVARCVTAPSRTARSVAPARAGTAIRRRGRHACEPARRGARGD